MFVKTTKANGYTYVSIVESYRKGKGPSKHRVLYNFGRYDTLRSDTGFINCIRKLCHLMEIPLLEDRGKAAFQECGEAEMVNYGYLAYARLWEDLGMRECLENLGRDCHLVKMDLQRTVLLMTVQHLLRPRSKLSTFEHQGLYCHFPEIPLSHLYRALDRLASGKEKIEQELFERNHLKLGQEVDVVFYDVTTFAFQSVNKDELKDFGYSKDCKFNEVQVVMGLLLDARGMPMGYELFPGNTFDSRTMVTSLGNLKRKFNVRRVVIVADRGLNSKGNLGLIRQAGYGYIMASRLRGMGREMREKALDGQGYTSVSSDFRYKTIPYVNVYTDEGGKTHELQENLIVSWSSKRAAKDAADRQRLVLKARKLLEKPSSIDALSKRGGKKYLKNSTVSKTRWVMDEKRAADDAVLDGYYAIQSSEKEMTATEVMVAFHMLWRIEDSFRVMKSTLEARPVFHWTPERIRGHFVMCFLAFMMQRKLESLLSKPKHDEEPKSPERIREALLSMQLAKVETNGETLYLKTRNLPLGSEVFRAVGLKVPMNVSREEQLREIMNVSPGMYDGQITFW